MASARLMLKQLFQLTNTNHLTVSIHQQRQKRRTTVRSTGNINNCWLQTHQTQQLQYTANVNNHSVGIGHTNNNQN